MDQYTELRRDLEEFKLTTNRRLFEFETRNAVDEVHRTNVEKRLGSIEESLKWLVRLVVGAVVMALLTYILKGGLAVG